MAVAEEDFSFPATTANPPPYFFESPPLWRHVTHPGNSEIFKDEEDEVKFKLYSSQQFNPNNIIQRGPCHVHTDDGEEKMDMLWEDLNENFSRKCGKMAEESDNSSPGRDVRICCIKSLKLSKANGNTISWRKASILVLIRVLMKKGLAMHNSASEIKKLTC